MRSNLWNKSGLSIRSRVNNVDCAVKMVSRPVSSLAICRAIVYSIACGALATSIGFVAAQAVQCRYLGNITGLRGWRLKLAMLSSWSRRSGLFLCSREVRRLRLRCHWAWDLLPAFSCLSWAVPVRVLLTQALP